mgnify:CR=1 FL=1
MVVGSKTREFQPKPEVAPLVALVLARVLARVLGVLALVFGWVSVCVRVWVWIRG